MGVLRTALLAGSQNRWLRDRAPRHAFVRKAVARFMPGETAEEALVAVRALQAQGLGAVLTQLGENLADAAQAQAVRQHYLDLLPRLQEGGLDAEVSVKLTQLGLDFDLKQCDEHVLVLAERAHALGNWLWIDMESSDYVDRTLEIYRRARARFPRVGVCLQSYLYRTPADVAELLPLGAGIRLVKGAYREPPDRAFPRKRDVDESYFALARTLISPAARAAGVRAIFGTHDGALIRRIEALAGVERMAPAELEFQMLYGILRAEQVRLAGSGYRLRVLISYGQAWFAWYMRRLAERPANVLFVVKSLVAR